MDNVNFLEAVRPLQITGEFSVRASSIADNSSSSSTPIKAMLLSQAQLINSKNTKYTISKKIDLEGKSIVVPTNCILEFEGSGGLKNGKLVGDNTIIKANTKIFERVEIEGSWNCPGQIEWFATGCEIKEYSTGVFSPLAKDETANIQLALNSSFQELIFPPRIFYVSSTLRLTKEKKLTFLGSKMKQTLAQCLPNIQNTSIIYTNKNITLLEIAGEINLSDTIVINGGTFDVSLCPNYTLNCIVVSSTNSKKIWGIEINTNVYGPYQNYSGVGIYVNPYKGLYEGYITMCRINSNVSNFGTGIKLKSHHNGGVLLNWLTDVKIDGCIVSCVKAIHVEDVDLVGIYASIQPDYLFSTKNNGRELIYLDCNSANLNGVVWDLELYNGETYTHQYALNIINLNSSIVASDSFLGMISTIFGKYCIKGYEQCLVVGDNRYWKAPNPYNYINGTYDSLNDAFLGWDLILAGQVDFKLVRSDETEENVTVTNPNNMFRYATSGTVISALNPLLSGDCFKVTITPKITTRISNIFIYLNNDTDLSINNCYAECIFNNGNNESFTIRTPIQFGQLNIAPVLQFITAVLYSWSTITIKFYCKDATQITILRMSGFRPLNFYTNEYKVVIPTENGIDSSYISRVGGVIYGDLEVKGKFMPKFHNGIPIFWNGNNWVDSLGTIINI